MSKQSSWLFIRDNQSIWIERPDGLAMTIAGPGAERKQLSFLNEEALEAYQVGTAERLAADGWFLWAFDRERRQATRRALERNTPERRRTAATNTVSSR